MNLRLSERIICAYLIGVVATGLAVPLITVATLNDPAYLDVIRACMAACLTCVGCIVAVVIAYLLADLEDES